MSALQKYASDDVDEAGQPVRVCAEVGRKCVRSLQLYPILSREWFSVVDSLKQLARLVQLEGRMPANAKVSETRGRNKESEGTLWDQEAQENAIRILVEEAKVNLCLRMINDFKKWQYDPALKQEAYQQARSTYDLNEAALDQKCKAFEESLGLLLWRAFTHVETLQLMDIPLLIDHCALVLNHCEAVGKAGLNCSTREQEFLVMYYVASLFKHSEAVNNKELLEKTRELRVLPLAVSHILTHAGAEYTEDASLDIAIGLAALCDNEDFQTEWGGFLEAADRPTFLKLKEAFVEPILAASPEKRKDIRPLLDFFNTLARRMG